MSTPAVRTDREPIAKRFPQLGEFPTVHWQGWVAGAYSSGVPGPTDVHIQALVVLQPETAAMVTQRHRWRAAPADWDGSLRAELRQFAPADDAWQASEEFAEEVLSARYRGEVYLHSASGTVFLDVIGR